MATKPDANNPALKPDGTAWRQAGAMPRVNVTAP